MKRLDIAEKTDTLRRQAHARKLVAGKTTAFLRDARLALSNRKNLFTLIAS
ncbi:hypothetical protein RO575_06455 [Methylomonas sp. MO1]|uniref:hypothetical protein n=1 Tax=Methylomonas sp. MO1 TaxID=3073619 RepID=UPI0004B393FB|nr:hypothetical protein [Methylomonas sp. MO1]MDT4289190.1 hypothetical protein [Methylomonas sp. MO1]